jgi:hypothetical protein
MAVISSREVLPRTASHRFGEPPTAERKYVVTVDAPTPTQTVVNAVGIFHGAMHPEFAFLKCSEINVTEPDRQHAEISYRYELLKKDSDKNPLARPDVWSFSIGGAKVPALFYYHGSGNDDIRPLVNAAGDFIEGLESVEAEVKATINGNRATFPLAIASQVTNAINSGPYLGGAAYTWQCAGIGGQQATEVVDDVEINYYQISVELIYRASGWISKIPHVGWHFIQDNKKRKAWVWSAGDPMEMEDASAPQPLTDLGYLKYPGGSGDPDQLLRRQFPAVDFSGFFGTPPF